MVGVEQTFTEHLSDAKPSVVLFHVVPSSQDSLSAPTLPPLFLRLLTWGSQKTSGTAGSALSCGFGGGVHEKHTLCRQPPRRSNSSGPVPLPSCFGDRRLITRVPGRAGEGQLGPRLGQEVSRSVRRPPGNQGLGWRKKDLQDDSRSD